MVQKLFCLFFNFSHRKDRENHLKTTKIEKLVSLAIFLKMKLINLGAINFIR
jgi:hypothetical protein